LSSPFVSLQFGDVKEWSAKAKADRLAKLESEKAKQLEKRKAAKEAKAARAAAAAKRRRTEVVRVTARQKKLVAADIEVDRILASGLLRAKLKKKEKQHKQKL
jgi:hypothetical protein